MIDYYRILKISPRASAAEIKSAYRSLARKFHPDVNKDANDSSHDFARIAKAYSVLSDADERARYDAKLARRETGDSVMFSDNPHARRLRRMAIQRRMDAIVDRMIDHDRRETMALQQTVFPIVALFISTFFVGMLKPQFWANSTYLGKSILLTLFLVGLWHTFKRLHSGFSRYTYAGQPLHDSVLRDEEDEKPFSRTAAVSFLTVGIAASLGVGWAVGKYLEWIIMNMMANVYSPTLQYEFIFYPPIAVLLVDAVHFVANKADL